MKIINHPEETIIKPSRDEYIYEVGDVVKIREDLDDLTMNILCMRNNVNYKGKTAIIVDYDDLGYYISIDGIKQKHLFFPEDFIK